MRMQHLVAWMLVALSSLPCGALTPADYVRDRGPLIAITHVQVIDGTGNAVRDDQTVVIDHDRIAQVGPARKIKVSPGAEMIDGRGETLIPGLVGMHEHLFYPTPIAGTPVGVEQFVSFPALYLAGGVTTARTAGSMDPYGDLEIKRAVDSGRMLGPTFDLTTPYLEAGESHYIQQMHTLRDADDARALVRYWHSQGFTSVKAYTGVTPEELQAGINEAHNLGMKLTGHLCSIGYEQAIELGIDNFEHGPFPTPDGDLEANHVMVRQKQLLHPVAWARVVELHAAVLPLADDYARLLKKEMAFERAFVAAGGLLMAGCDPTGDSHTLAGIGDQRNIELLVEAGFTAPEAIRMATLNGATFEGIADRVGSIAVNKTADLVLLKGDLSKDITVIEKPERVFKAGAGYDSEAIFQALAGQVGLH